MRIKTISILLIVIMATGLFSGCDSKDSEIELYNKAETLFNDGEYEKAAIAFEALGEYKGAHIKAGQARRELNSELYYEAISLLNQGNYEQAIEMLDNLKDYRDSPALADAARKRFAFSEWFTDISWDTLSIRFTALKQVELKGELTDMPASFRLGDADFIFNIGITVCIDGKNIGFRESSTISNGKAFVSINGDNVVATIDAGTTIYVYPENEGKKPDRIIIEFLDGTVLEMVDIPYYR